MSLTSYRAAPPRAGAEGKRCDRRCIFRIGRFWFLSRFGGDLLSHVLRRSTIGATALIGRVREGIGSFARAMTTKPRKKPAAGLDSRPGLRGGALRRHRSFRGSSGALGACSKFRLYVLLTVSALARDVQGGSDGHATVSVLLFLDQIKPIEQLVPVS
jgi:hypothetical protein